MRPRHRRQRTHRYRERAAAASVRSCVGVSHRTRIVHAAVNRYAGRLRGMTVHDMRDDHGGGQLAPRDARYGDVDISAAAALIADPARATMLMALDDGRALPATRLADEAGVSAQSASNHLRKLVEGGLLQVSVSGRHRYYALANDAVGAAIEGLAGIGRPRVITSLRQGTRANALRTARTCYDHLAGVLGVLTAQALLDHRAVVRADGQTDIARRPHDPLTAGTGDTGLYRLGPDAKPVLAALHVDIATLTARRTSRPLIRACVDWTEQRHHFAGRLGAALTTAWLDAGWIRRGSHNRAITISDSGIRELQAILAIDLGGRPQ